MTQTGEDGSLREVNTSEALQSLPSTLNSTRRARPPAMEISTGLGEVRVPLKQPKIQRKESKGGLRSLFTRNKAEKPTAFPVLEEGTPASGISERSMRAVAEAGLRRSMSLRRTKTGTQTLPIVPATPATPTTLIRPTSRSSRMNFRTKSTRQTKTPSKPSPKSPKSASKSATRRASACWDPPPLFQAYPQAIKHAQLSASTLSADVILRISNQKSNTLRDEIAQARMGSTVNQTANANKSEKINTNHRRQLSGSISKADWTQKIFVLVTSGYLLQYAGDGSFDRLPEKMMQLGKDSVAFASDVIPGKHWVLQISQAMDADGTPAADSRSLISRLAFRGADYRRTASSLLLVLNSAEDMDSWLAVVRREIEALGGKKHISETGKPKPDDKVMQFRAQPSHRYLVTRDPDQAPEPSSPQLPSLWIKEKYNELQEKLDAVTAMTSPQLPSIRPSTGDQSIANTITSQGERQLDSLRDGSNRFSYMSSGQRTLITSQGPSPATSPTRDSAPSFDDILPKVEVSEAKSRPNTAEIERRRSMQTTHIPALEASAPPKNHRYSTYGGTNRNARSYSPGAPNFSVQISSSKRYSVSKVPDANAPPLPWIPVSTAGQSRAPSLKKVTHRSLSPVKVVQSTKGKSLVASSTDSSVTTTMQYEPSTNDGQSSPTVFMPSYSDAPVSRRHRESSITSMNSSSKVPADFQFPRRFSSMQTRLDGKGQHETREPRFKRMAPAPMELLPDLPSTPVGKEKEGHVTERQCIIPTPTPAIANIKTKLWRPISMQVETSNSSQSLGPSATPSCHSKSSPSNYVTSAMTVRPLPSSRSPTLPNLPPQAPNTMTPALNEDDGILTPVTILSPSLSRLRGEGSKMLGNRRSMPTLVNGPPPAPPPDCALPPLPPTHVEREGSRGPIGVQRGIPLRV